MQLPKIHLPKNQLIQKIHLPKNQLIQKKTFDPLKYI
jgi:hypothetical protein